MKNLTIIKKSEPANLEDIKNFEINQGIKLPNDYRSFLIKSNPISVSETLYKKNEREFWLSNFYPFNKDYQPSVQSTWKNLSDFFENKHLAFADDAGGWQFVICLNEENYGKVFFCRMDEPLKEALTPLANSFSEFINGLKLSQGEIGSLDQKVKENIDPLPIQSKKEAFMKGMTHFTSLAQDYDMGLTFEGDYEYGFAKMFNTKCTVKLSMDRYSPNMNIYFVNPSNNKEYNYGLVMRKREVFKIEKLPSHEDLNENKQIVKKLKNIAFLMNKYCSDILLGDFSTVEESDV